MRFGITKSSITLQSKQSTVLALSVREVSKDFGGLHAVDRVSFELGEGELVGVIGPNGAGKTTLFNLITGFERCTSGTITWCGENITGMPPQVIATRGLVRTFQQTRVFPRLTSLGNVLVGCHSRLSASVIGSVLRTRNTRCDEEQGMDRALEVLKLVGLSGVGDVLARDLPFGYSRRLGIAIALASGPKGLLLDEPAAGLASEEVVELHGVIERIRESGVSILLVDHNMRFVMGLARRVLVLHNGQRIAEGTPEDVQRDARVLEAYLGAALC